MNLWIQIVTEDGDRKTVTLEHRLNGLSLRRVEVHCTPDDFASDELREWLDQVFPRLDAHGAVTITVSR